MIEMLIAAAIMAIGLLGLCMLQTFVLRSRAGSSNQAVAIQVAEQVLDQAENIGRNSVFCSHNGYTVPVAATNYFSGTAVALTYTSTGLPGAPAFFTATCTATTAPAAGTGVVTPVAQIGGVALVQVVVTWTETAGNPRNVTLTRQIQYATN